MVTIPKSIQKGSDRLTNSLILLVSVLLLVTLFPLGERVLAVNGVKEPFPNLYATLPGRFIQPEQKTVYFTFDDGPSKNTEVLLDLFQEEGIKATFFVCAQEEDQEHSKMLLRRMRDEGHTIGLHSYTHNFGEIYASLETYLEDLDRINQFVFEATGEYPQILRFPGGSRTQNADPALMRRIADEVTRRGYVFYDWTVVSGDDGPVPAPVEQLVGNVMGGVAERQIEIILFHDNATPVTTPETVKQSIGLLKEQGYVFDGLHNEIQPIQRIYETG